MAIKFYNDGTAFRLPRKRDTARWVAGAVRREGRLPGDISCIFCSQEKHLEINRTYLGHDYPTDVITFDYGDPATGCVSGDIFIDPVTVAENAKLFGTTRGEEMRRVIIHGALHLCGYKDATPAQQKRMRDKEDEYLAQFPQGT